MQSQPRALSSANKPLPIVSTGLVLLIAGGPLLPDFVLVDPGAHNAQRILQAFGLSLLPLVITRLAKRCNGLPAVNLVIIVLLSLFLLAGFVASTASFSPRLALLEWTLFFLLIALGFVIASEIAGGPRQSVRLVLTAVGIGCALYELNVALIYAVGVAHGISYSGPSFIFGFENYRFFNHGQTVSLPLLVLLVALQPRFSRRHTFWFIVATLWWTLLLVSGGRGTAVGLAAGFLAVLILLRGRALRFGQEFLLTAVAGLAGYLLLFYAVPMSLGLGHWGAMSDIVERSVAAPTSNRIGLWKLSLEMMQQQPWFGFGPVHFAHLASQIDAGAHPHNWMLQIGAEWGVPALVLLCITIALVGRVLLRISRDLGDSEMESHTTLSAWTMGCSAILVDGLFSGLIVMPLSQLWISLFLGLVWGWCTWHRVGPEPVVRGWRPPGIAGPIALAALVVIMWTGLLPEALDPARPESLPSTQALYPNDVFRPRIWTAGYF